MTYAGIGSRETPPEIIVTMLNIGKYLAKEKWILRSGGADGADTAFETGCDSEQGQKEIFLPWKNFNKNDSSLFEISGGAIELAQKYHPAWGRLKQGAQKLMARNVYQVLGYDLKSPSDCIVCWTSDGEPSGGTGQAIRIATDFNIPVFNLWNNESVDKFKKFIKK